VPRPRPRGRARRGQSEVLGGLIILTLIFMFAVPLLITLYYANVQAGQAAARTIAEAQANLNERLSVGPVDPNSPIAQRADWIPGVWINNTGTVAVTLDKLYLVDEANKTIFIVYDFRYTRPVNTTYVREMLLNPQEGSSEPLPPAGEPITLQPGDKLLIVFNKTLLPIAPNLIVLVESASGVLHPLAGGGGVPTLYPGRPQLLPVNGTWRGVFAPQSGFSLRGYDDLAKRGTMYAWRPPIHVYPDRDCDRTYEPEDLDYDTSFIYEDPDYPGLYKLYIVLDDGEDTCVAGHQVYGGYTIVIRGFLGTYDTGDRRYGTYFNGYAYAVEIYNEAGVLVASEGPYDFYDDMVKLPSDSIIESDFDGNNVTEVTFYSYLNGPNYEPENIDADDDDDSDRDALAWTYMVARDISGVDYIKVTIKLNYYWTTTFTSCPYWNVRNLKVFAIVVWKYDPGEGRWVVHQYQNYGFTSEKPVQFQETAVFPVEYNGTYRVGIMVYDNYRDFDYAFGCWTDFTMALEHMIVEYGVYNPFFVESPPLYIIAIPDPNLIGGIGAPDYMNARGVTSPDQAKVLAQQELLAKIKGELSYAGIAGYTIVTTPQDFCNLLFSADPPKYAIIYWLQGNVSVSQVAEAAGCDVDDEDLAGYAATHHWVIVWAFSEPFGDALKYSVYNPQVAIAPEGNYTLNITSAGVEVRRNYYAFYLYNTLQFKYAAQVYAYPINETLIVEATFYSTTGNYTINDKYGTVAYWLAAGPGSGVVVFNPVHIDWDLTGDGVIPETLAQQIVYSSLTAWVKLLGG